MTTEHPVMMPPTMSTKPASNQRMRDVLFMFGGCRRYGQSIFDDSDALVRGNNPETENTRGKPLIVADHVDLVLHQIIHLGLAAFGTVGGGVNYFLVSARIILNATLSCTAAQNDESEHC
jgi:hypothetical protein